MSPPDPIGKNKSVKAATQSEDLMSYEKGTHVLFFGNPGSGKSTLLNCLMQLRSPTPLTDGQLFKSGVSIGSGMTYELDEREVNGVVYMDTPGLDDRKKRKEAAEAITKALRQEGSYQVVFVLTLEAGRIKTADAVTMQMVLKSAPIKHFGIIFNKLEKEIIENIDKETQEILLTELATEQDDYELEGDRKQELPLPIPIYIERMAQLDGKRKALAEVEDLECLMRMIPPYEIDKNKVYALKIERYDARLKQMQEQMDYFREHTLELSKKMEEQRLMYEEKILELSRQNDEYRKRYFPFSGAFLPKANLNHFVK